MRRRPRTKSKRKRRRPLNLSPDNAVARKRERTCIVTGVSAPGEQLLRFALAPDGVVAADLAAKLPGRGAWVTAARAAVEKAAAKGLFARAFKRQATAPAGLSATVEAGLEKRALAALGLARRAGDAAVGFDRVRDLLREGGAAAFVSAADGAEDGYSKLVKLAGKAVVVRAFSGRDLSAALGRDGVVHAALKKGASAERFLREARRLDGFRPVLAAAGAHEGVEAL